MHTENRNTIRTMFNTIAARYDFINRTVSFRRDVAWRKALIAALPQDKKVYALDLASGTGDVLIALLKSDHIGLTAVGADLSELMLAKAATKLRHNNIANRCTLVVSDAAALCFPDSRFHVVTVAFGVRNFSEISKSLQEMHRVLQPGGSVLILEFSLPDNVVLRTVYLLYFRRLLPLIAGWISRQPDAYRYLNRSVEAFPYGEAFATMLSEAGFMVHTIKPLTFGIATLYVGYKQE